MKDKNISKKMCYILRHNPSAYDIILDKYGYANINLLTKALNISLDRIISIVNNDPKSRYRINNDKIKCNFGHSIPVEIEPCNEVIPNILYHGTIMNNLKQIKHQGLNHMSREYVHLTNDLSVARQVSLRYAKVDSNVIILEIDANRMLSDDKEIIATGTSTFLTKHVDTKYLIGIVEDSPF